MLLDVLVSEEFCYVWKERLAYLRSKASMGSDPSLGVITSNVRGS